MFIRTYQSILAFVRSYLLKNMDSRFSEDDITTIAHDLMRRLRWDKDALERKYIRKAVHSAAIDFLRRRERTRRREIPLDEVTISRCFGPSPSPRFEELIETVETSIGRRLSDRDSRLLKLRVEGYSWEEVAGRLGMTSLAARQRMYELCKQARAGFAA